MKRKRLLLTLLVCTVIVILIVPIALSLLNNNGTVTSESIVPLSSSNGTTEVVSTESTSSSTYPSLAVDSAGNVHVAWQDVTDYAGSGTDFDVFYKRCEFGVGWTSTEVVSTESTSDSHVPSLAVDSAGNVHVAWQDVTDYAGSGTDFDVFYKRCEFGVGWTTTEVVSTESTGGSHSPSLAVDSSGNVYVAWWDYTDYDGSGTDKDVFYKRCEFGVGWTTTEVVSTESTGDSVYPSLAVDSSGDVHVAWYDYTDYAGAGIDIDIFYKRFVVGVGWTSTEVVSTESTGDSSAPSLAVDLSGNVHVAWQDVTDYAGSGIDIDIFYKRCEFGVGWTTTEVVSTGSTGTSFDPSLAVDLSGNVHVAWLDTTDYAGAGTDRDIFYKRFVVGSGWTVTEVVSTESTDHSFSPSLSVDSSGNVHLAWHDDTDYAGSGADQDIFYKLFGFSVPAEPASLRDIVEFPGAAHLIDLPTTTYPPDWETLTTTEIVSTESTDDSKIPSLAVDHYGNIHVVWHDSTDYADSGTDDDIFYKRYRVGIGWTTTEVVSTESTGISRNPSLAVDLNGNLHVAWTDYTNYGGSGADTDIFYKRCEFGVGWTSTEVVSTESTLSSSYPSLAVDSSGDVQVAWNDYTDYAGSGADADIFYKRFVVGSGWTTTEVVSTESTDASFAPSLAVGPNGNLHVAWHDPTDYGGAGTDLDIFYKRFVVGSGWTTTEVVSTESTSNSGEASLSVDSTGNIHIAWQDMTDYAGAGADIDIFYKRYKVGSGWTTTEVVSTESTNHSHDPSLAVDTHRNIHVAWYDYTDYAGSGADTDIFYKRFVVGSGWTTTEVVSTESTNHSYMPSLAVDTHRNIHIAWYDSTDYAGSGTDQDIFYKWSGSDKYWILTTVTSTVEGLPEIKNLLETRGFTFKLAASSVSLVDGGLDNKAFSGALLSWWSNPDANNIYALLVVAMMDDGHNMVFGAYTNILPTELVWQDSYIIVNAMPYSFIRWFYYDTLNSRIVDWSYSWSESDSPNWFWGIYWKWRNYINEYYGWHTYLPWWWWFWHYTYDKHWHNWSAEFPY